jgi:DNA-binding NtrC family response regulator
MPSFRDFNALLSPPQGGPAPSARHAIIVIDDDAAIRDSLSFLFSDQYEITTCASAKEGVAAVHEDICAIVLDVKMPGQDGFWACAEIRKKAPDIPVIFYSAYQNLKDPYAIINEHRPFGYVAKGDEAQKLVEMLEAAVELQAAVVENRRLLRSLETPEGLAR